MKITTRIKSYLIFFFLLSIIFVNYNIIVNSHLHVDEHGQFSFHAHPYSKANDHTTAYPKHTHTKIEFLYFAQVLHILPFVLILLLILIIPKISKCYCCRDHYIPQLFLYLIPLRRGPPIYFPFI
jgi:hypothetical protein